MRAGHLSYQMILKQSNRIKRLTTNPERGNSMQYAKTLIARPLNVSSLEGLKWSGCMGSYSLYKASSEAEKSYSEMSALSAERFNYEKKA